MFVGFEECLITTCIFQLTLIDVHSTAFRIQFVTLVFQVSSLKFFDQTPYLIRLLIFQFLIYQVLLLCVFNIDSIGVLYQCHLIFAKTKFVARKLSTFILLFCDRTFILKGFQLKQKTINLHKFDFKFNQVDLTLSFQKR